MPTFNVQNRTLFHGDNLPFLRGINSGTVHLIATDPPFNKGRDFHATPDSLAAGAKFEDRWSWDKDVHQDWIDAIQDDWPAVWEVIYAARAAAGEDMAAYLCWLGVRLLEMHRVLREDGSLYLHIDHTAHAWVKTLLDAIFGRHCFVNEIIWHYRKWSTGKYAFQQNHDTILLYARSETRDRTFNQLFMPRAVSTLKRFGTKKIVSGHDASGRRLPSTVSGESDGVRQDDVWDIKRVAPIKQLYPTQKPLPLYERIIEASTNRGDVVLDPFCGCATTPVAAERLGRQWVGMDIWDGAHQMVIDRLQKEGLAGPDGETDRLLTFGQIGYSTVGPVRTDDKAVAAPPLKLKVQIAEPPGPKMTRAEMVDFLIVNNGMVCQGCDRQFDDPLYLELDHNTPRSDGGLNHISNRLLLCGPCNRIKSNKLTLSGLRAENQKRGRMASVPS